MPVPVHERELTRTLMLAFEEAQLIAASAVCLTGEAATTAMVQERRRLHREWREKVHRATRKGALKGQTEDDYRSRIPDTVGEPEESRDQGGEREATNPQEDAQGGTEQSS